MSQAAYEKLGAFYLGKEWNPDADELKEDLFLYDSKDLVTHAVCVGMTGSGKTGLGVGLIEEAAMDGVPSIVIDPKGDLTNLLLTFPGLDAASFRPWVDEGEARRKGITVDELAKKEAAKWKKGLASWDQDGARIAKLRETVDLALYTPGSTAATPISVLASFDAPPPEVQQDAEAMGERTSAVVSSLLSLLGLDADPVRSRDHVLLSNILKDAWSRGESPDLAGLIHLVQNPPIQRIGVIELESFYPAKERFELAMALNGLAASPRFQTWLQGVPLDPDRLLYGTDGKPRVSILSIAHLSDEERMFFVTLLLDRVVSWMRSRPGTSSLRALIYMDEVFGYLPPTANPPSKQLLLTLLKQARAFGVGLVLSTQNPVDLDYKALSNAGTWFIGRLQTERDRERLLAGLTGAGAGALDAGAVKDLLSQIDKRVFLAHNVHEDEPVLFHTRWVMSYLAGPLARPQLERLAKQSNPLDAPPAGSAPEGAAADVAPQKSARPVLAPGVPEAYLSARGASSPVEYEPAVLAEVELSFRRRGSTQEHKQSLTLLSWLDDDAPDWEAAEELAPVAQRIDDGPAEPATWLPLPGAANHKTIWPKWQRALQNDLYRDRRIEMFRNKKLKLESTFGESERDFRIRLQDTARELRDEAVEKLRDKYESKMATLDERIRKAEAAIEREQAQARTAGLQTMVSVGTAVLAMFGRKSSATKVASAARGAARTAQQSGDIGRAKENAEALRARKADLVAKLEEDIDELEDKFDALGEDLEVLELAPRKTDVHVERFTLLWVPRGAELPPAE